MAVQYWHENYDIYFSNIIVRFDLVCSTGEGERFYIPCGPPRNRWRKASVYCRCFCEAQVAGPSTDGRKDESRPFEFGMESEHSGGQSYLGSNNFSGRARGRS